eukprot:CAMPEP_0117036772 /NCGR_PEP_ID=MMETSP0472-20121206/26016_1 /TAXON_ID=693140 ORGANISM="Tiarina fusus, Strain LIS" /NCGR_SAMPLE_ID=MMETSP0472 /ASSEMBLY_ACC=CAM_ASM_000603 /LENGTH=297 /DNA_ID=CAMNT_0004746603 /DNA_START=27 /DNA_END=920 /DNA_ORIENTATION=+
MSSSLDQYFMSLRATKGASDITLVNDHGPSSPIPKVRKTSRKRSHTTAPSYGPPSVPARQDSTEGIDELMILQRIQQARTKTSSTSNGATTSTSTATPTTATTTRRSDKVLNDFYKGVAPAASMVLTSPRKSYSFSGGTTKNERWARFMGLSSDVASSASPRRVMLQGMFAEALADAEAQQQQQQESAMTKTNETSTTTTTTTRRRSGDSTATTSECKEEDQEERAVTSQRRILSDCLAEAEQFLADETKPRKFQFQPASRRNSFHVVMRDARWSSRPVVTSMVKNESPPLIRGMSA